MQLADSAKAAARSRRFVRSLPSLAVLTAIAVVMMWWSGPAGADAALSRPAAAQSGIVPPKNPSRSLAPSPDFIGSGSCASRSNGRSCNREVLKAIAHARKRLEKMPMQPKKMVARR